MHTLPSLLATGIIGVTQSENRIGEMTPATSNCCSSGSTFFLSENGIDLALQNFGTL